MTLILLFGVLKTLRSLELTLYNSNAIILAGIFKRQKFQTITVLIIWRVFFLSIGVLLPLSPIIRYHVIAADRNRRPFFRNFHSRNNRWIFDHFSICGPKYRRVGHNYRCKSYQRLIVLLTRLTIMSVLPMDVDASKTGSKMPSIDDVKKELFHSMNELLARGLKTGYQWFVFFVYRIKSLTFSYLCSCLLSGLPICWCRWSWVTVWNRYPKKLKVTRGQSLIAQTRPNVCRP